MFGYRSTRYGEPYFKFRTAFRNARGLHVLLYLFDNFVFVRIPLRVIVSVLNRRTARVLGVCPGFHGHGPVDIFTSTARVESKREFGIHCRHYRPTDVYVGNFARVYTDITVTELPRIENLIALRFHTFESVGVALGELRNDIVEVAARKFIDCVSRARNLHLQFFALYVKHKVVVSLIVNDVAAYKARTRRIIAVVDVGRLERTCAERNFYFARSLNYVVLEIVIAPFNAVLVFGYINRLIAVIVYGSNGEAEVVNSLGIGTFYGYLQRCVFVGIFNRAVLVVFGSDFISRSVDFHRRNQLIFRAFSYVSQRPYAFDKGEHESGCAACGFFVKNNVFCFRNEFGSYGIVSTPAAAYNLIEFGSYGVVVNLCDSLFFGGYRLKDFFAVELIDLGLVFLTFFFVVFGGNHALVQQEFKYFVFKLIRPFFIGSDGKVVSVFRVLVVVFEFFGESFEYEIVVGSQFFTIIVVGKSFLLFRSGNRVFIARSNGRGSDSRFHLLGSKTVRVLRTFYFTVLFVNGFKLENTVGCTGSSRFIKRAVGIFLSRFVFLRSVLFKTFNLYGVHSGRTRVYGIDVLVDIKHYVVDGKGNAVREFKSVFKHERINGIARTVRSGIFYFIRLYYGSLVITGNGLAAFVGRKHTYLR